MGHAEPPKSKLPEIPLEISGMFSVQSISHFLAEEACDNKGYPSLNYLRRKEGGRVHHLPGDGW